MAPCETLRVPTTVTITGSGVPHVQPGRAGPGALVSCGKVHLQFDAGRATTLRLSEAGVPLHWLTALFVTHHHSDHLTGLDDVLFTRWLERHDRFVPLPVVAPDGPAVRFLQRIFEPWDADIEVRKAHVGRTDGPHPDIRAFTCAGPSPVKVWRHDSTGIRVLASAVHHEPVAPAVAYRVDTPDGAVVVSGDTRVCDEVADLARGANVLVHEAMRSSVLRTFAEFLPHVEHLIDYHADTVELGAMAARAGVPHLVLTHLIPAPVPGSDDELEWIADVRRGGYEGAVTVARDLTAVTF